MKKPTNISVRARSQRGQSLIFVCFFMSVLLGMTSLVVDLGLAWLTRLRMQQAADAAALAAVMNLENSNAATAEARALATLNTFTHGVNNTNVYVSPPNTNNGTLSVTIQQPFTTLFMAFLGIRTLNIGATATARFRTLLPLSVNANVAPGAATSQTLSVWGPRSRTSNGDPYSPQFLNGGGANPNHIPGGYNFQVKFPANYITATNTNIASIAVFDPDIYQTGTNTSTNTEYEEIGDPPTGVTNPGNNRRGSTKFTLYAPDNTPSDFSDDVVLADFTSDGNNNIVTVRQLVNGNYVNVNTNTRPNGHWVTMSNVNVAALGAGPYRINVLPVSGSSENGFDIVAVPPSFIKQATPAANLSAAGFTAANAQIQFNNMTAANANNNAAYWTNTSGSVTASGYLPINFRTTGNVSVPLGDLPVTNANLNVHVIKFDTDVGSNISVRYFDTAGRVNNVAGTVAANNAFAQDDLLITGPYVGGSLRAVYTAASNDTSVWSSFLDGYLPGNPGRPQLID